MIRAVAFDLGGVLIQIHHEWEGAMRELGLAPSRPFGALGGFPAFDRYQNGDIGRSEYLSELSRFLSLGSTDQALAVHMEVLRDEYEGVSALIEQLCAQDIVCGCLSNTNEAHWEMFFNGRYGFGPHLSVRVGSHLERASKPDARIFAAFEARTGLEPAEIAYFDDGHSNIEAAAARGWQAHMIDPHGDTAVQMRTRLGLP